MKKIVKNLLIVLLIIILLVSIITVKATSAGTLKIEYSNVYWHRQKADGSDHYSWFLSHYTIDGEVAYCIEPNIPEGTTYVEGTWEDMELDDSIKERLLLIGYYGYTYPGHNTEQYLAATQGLIWDLIIGEGVKTEYNYERWGLGEPFDISNEEAEINRLVDHHFDRPSFNAGVYTVQKGDTLTLTDTNNVLNQFDITISGGTYEKEGENTIKITPTTDETIDVTFIKKMPYSEPYKLFSGNEYQNMLVPGMVDPVIAKVRIKSYTSTVEITKKDRELNNSTPQGQATLKGAKYGIYEQSTGNLVEIIETDEQGYAKSNSGLTWNDYYLQEISPSEGYLLDNTKYNFDMKNKENEQIKQTEEKEKNKTKVMFSKIKRVQNGKHACV